MSAPVEQQATQAVFDVAMDLLKPVCLMLDSSFRVTYVLGDLGYYGYTTPHPGVDCREVLPMIYGLESSPGDWLPVLETPNGQAVDVRWQRQDDAIRVLLTDSTAHRNHAAGIQQTAHETSIGRYRVEQLADRLHQAHAELEAKQAQLEAANVEIGKLAVTDEMTGLHNRRGFLLLARQELELARRSGMRSMFVFCDVDGLKTVNDTWGHAEGDALLIAAGQAFASAFRKGDVVARLGGDEFCAFMADCKDEAGSIETAIRQRFEAHALPGKPYRLAATVGVIPCPLDGADAEMYESKRARRARQTATG